MVTNIITGYQKAQKGMLTPFKQMHGAFDVDCCECEKMYIIGYGSGDEHINESIKTAIRHNPNIKIVIVDPNFKKNDLAFALKYFPFRETGNMMPENIGTKSAGFFDRSFIVHTVPFQEFLESRMFEADI